MPGPRVYDNTFALHDSGGNEVFFEASNQDLADATHQYFGYISSFGSWLVQRFHIQGDTVIYEYSAGKTRTDYDALWNAAGTYIGGLTFTTFDRIADSL